MVTESFPMSPQSSPVNWQPLWDVMRLFESHETWVPTTEEMYTEMLNVLPPAATGRSCFLVGEPSHTGRNGETMYACFVARQGQYLARYMTLQEFRSLFNR